MRSNMSGNDKNTIDEMRFSFSNLSSFETCKYGWFLTYIEKKERSNNFFAEFGTLVHETMEKYFRDELEIFELEDYFKDNYDKTIVSPAPFFIKVNDYYEQGLKFFSEFRFKKEDYEILIIEDKIDVDLENYKLVIKPDLILKEKSTGKVIMFDYKTSIVLKNGKIDKKKLAGYKQQMMMYSNYAKTVGINIEEIYLWFIRQPDKKKYKFSVTQESEKEVVDWVEETITKIKKEEKFSPNVDDFFCQNLCSVSQFCKYKPKSKYEKEFNPE